MNCALLIIVLIPGNTESAKAKTRTGHYITFYAYVKHLGHATEYADAHPLDSDWHRRQRVD